MAEEEKSKEEHQIIRVEDMSLDELQMSEQLYTSAGLDPVVDAGLKDYDERIRGENKLISKVLGPRDSDIHGYGEAVAKRVAYAVYALLNRQYGGKVGDLRSYIMTLEDERNRANTRYDELMGRVVGILGEEFKELRTDSKEFMEKLTDILGEDLNASKIDQKALAESLADIDGLRAKIKGLEEELKQQKEDHEAQIAGLETRISGLEAEKTALTENLARLQKERDALRAAAADLLASVPHEEIGDKLGEDLYSFILKDSRVPDAVIKGVGQFIDFKKYLRMAAAQAAEEATRQAKEKMESATGD
jgi:hypothetical protein